MTTEKSAAFARAAHAATAWIHSGEGYNSHAYREYCTAYADLEKRGWLEEFKPWFRARRLEMP